MEDIGGETDRERGRQMWAKTGGERGERQSETEEARRGKTVRGQRRNEGEAG